jgi:DNA (cytosine-5)-methyltransferase 1
MAGKRKGTEDDRHLWPEMLRAIREIKPTWVVGENVFGITNWDGGVVFNQVQIDLEAEGHEVQPYVLPACSVNAPHRRDRVWFVAYNSGKSNLLQSDGRINSKIDSKQREEARKPYGEDSREYTPNTKSTRLEGNNYIRNKKEKRECVRGNATGYDKQIIVYPLCRRQSCEKHGQEKPGRITKTCIRNDWQDFPTQSPLCSRDDGLSDRLAGITFSKHRNESIKAYGNAIVPQIAYQIFKAIEQYELVNN